MPRVEDFYVVPPIEIELTGGSFDGRRMHVPEHRDEWLMPVPPSVSLYASEVDVTRPSFDVERYRWTGHIRDDGTRVFQYAP